MLQTSRDARFVMLENRSSERGHRVYVRIAGIFDIRVDREYRTARVVIEVARIKRRIIVKVRSTIRGKGQVALSTHDAVANVA